MLDAGAFRSFGRYRREVLWQMLASIGERTAPAGRGAVEEGTTFRALDEDASYVGLIICRQMPDNAAGVLFVTMEDETGFVNLIVCPKAFERYRSTILSVSFLGVTGEIQTGEGIIHIIAERFWLPELSRKPTGVKSRDFH